MRVLAGVVASGLLFAGCTSAAHSPRDTGTPPVTQSPSTTAPSTTAPSTTTPAFPPGPGTTVVPTDPVRVRPSLTAPRTQLPFGQPARVPLRLYDRARKEYDEGVLGIVVYPLQRIAGSKVQGNFNEHDRALLNRNVAYYAKVIFTNEGGTPGLPAPADAFLDLYRSGGEPPDIVVTGATVPGCVHPLPEHFERKGARWQSCVFAVTSPSERITQIQYDQPPYGKELKADGDKSPNFNKYYNLGNITWR